LKIFRFKLVILTIFILGLIYCCHTPNNSIIDLIQPLHLQAGRSDTLHIQDIFFARDYQLKFLPHAHISIKYDSLAGKLILTPEKNYQGLSLISFLFFGKKYEIPSVTTVLQEHTFFYKPKHRVKAVNVFGSFNSWNRNDLPLTDTDGDGIYTTTLSFEPGRYEYKFFVDGEEILDPLNPDKVSNPFGSFNSVLTILPRNSSQPELHFLHTKETNTDISIELAYNLDNRESIISPDQVIVLAGNQMIPLQRISVSGEKINISLDKSQQQGKQVIRVAIAKNDSFSRFHSFYLTDGQVRGSGEKSFDWHDAIVYSIMVDRFKDGDASNTRPVDNPEVDPKANFYGGDLQGILDKLNEGYFDSLGVNVLWLSPIVQNTFGAFREYPEPHRYFTGYHGYWPIESKIVDVRFGDLNLFKKLVRTAHQKNMKILLDFVSNHVHKDHPYYRNHPEWFGTLDLPNGRKNIRLWDEYRLTTWFDTFLPSFDYAGSPVALKTMTDVGVWWLQETGMDGFRQDAVKHVPNEFWRTLTRKIKSRIGDTHDPGIFQIGETFGSYQLISSYVNNGQLDAQFNFNLYDVALQVFLNPEASFALLDKEMSKTFDVYGMNHLMGNVMDSHDKVRYMAYADGDITLSTPNTSEVGWENPPQVDDTLSYRKVRLYQAYLLTIPGIPFIYYGDEIGITGAADPDNRRPMRFEPNLNTYEREMLRKVSQLVKIRRRYSALRYGDFLPLVADDQIYAFLCSDPNGRILVILNKADKNVNVKISLPEELGLKQARNVLNPEQVPIKENILEDDISKINWKIYQLF
jgi:cyclomaltodextrinase